MAKAKKYTEQFSFVGTKTAYDLQVAVAERAYIDKAPIVRAGVDRLFGLVDGELREGDTFEAAVQRVVDSMQSVLSLVDEDVAV
jgi:hypothetical protein